MKRILFVATVPEHYRYFHLPCFKMLQEHGYEVHTVCGAAEDFPYTDKQFVIPIGRSPLDPQNKEGLRQLKKIIAEGDYDIVHCHTPMGGALARLAARKARKKGTKVFYTAHGFHFYKGAPLPNWLIFFPIEWILSRFTDTLITINREDYGRAKRFFKAKRIAYVHGVGCDLSRFYRLSGEERKTARKNLGLPEDGKLMVYVAEQNANKNQGMLIRTAKALSKEIDNLHLVVVGPDHAEGVYEKLAAELAAPVTFMGERRDVPDILAVCDLYTASSLREGLPVNVMEAMATGLPVVAMNNRGHRALVEEGETGFIVDLDEAMTEKVRLLLTDDTMYNTFSQNAKTHIAPFGLEPVLGELAEYYFK